MTAQVLDYLSTKGYLPKRSGVGPERNEARFACFFHGEESGKPGRLYVNTDENGDGVYYCQVCEERGNYITLRRHFGDPVEPTKESGNARRWALMWSAAEYYHRTLSEHPDVVKYLNDRGITNETIVARKLGWSDGTLFGAMLQKGYSEDEMRDTGLIANGEFFNGSITIPYLSGSSCQTIRGKEIDGKYRTLSGDRVRLYNVDAVWGTEEVLVCEGEFDSMILSQLGFDAVGLPGAGAFQKDWVDFFSGVKRVFCLFDNDDSGRKGAAKVQQLVGTKTRVLDIGPAVPDTGDKNDKNDVTDWVVHQGHTADDVEALCKSSSAGLLVTVDDAYTEYLEWSEADGLITGYRKLDTAWTRGPLPGQVLVMLAKSGTGKTVMLLNLFQRIRMQSKQVNTKILFVSLEQTRGEVIERLLKIGKFYDPWLDDEGVLEYWRNNLLIVDKNRVREHELETAIDDFEYQMGDKPHIVAVDYLGYFARGFKGEGYQRTSDAIMALKAIGKERRIIFIVPQQVNRGTGYGETVEADGARDSGVIEETADFVFGLSAPGYNNKDKDTSLKLKINKSRHGGTKLEVDLALAPLHLGIVQTTGEDELNQRVKREVQNDGKVDAHNLCLQGHRVKDTFWMRPYDKPDKK